MGVVYLSSNALLPEHHTKNIFLPRHTFELLSWHIKLSGSPNLLSKTTLFKDDIYTCLS